METLLVAFEVVILVAVMMSIVYTVGIVWRVEEELDISYKFFAFSIAFFLISEILSVYYAGNDIRFVIAEKANKVLFTLFFLVGTLCMRDIVRKLDGEKSEKTEKK